MIGSCPRGPRLTPLAVAPALFLLPAPGLGGASAVHAQVAEVREEENLRAEPNGVLLGRLEPGTRMGVVADDGAWVGVVVEGWVWTPSLQLRGEAGFDLVVSATDGENIREEPQGRILGRLNQGTLLEELERIPGWIRVRREAWIWRSSLDISQERAQEPEPVDRPAAEPGPAVAETEWLTAGEDELTVYSQPDGDILARATPGSDLRLLSREGNWGRVRLEGWVWMPGLEGETGGEALLREVRPADIPEASDRFSGRLVELPLQFISLETADRMRTDFYEGEPFLLTRAVEGTRIFVYVAVPPERLVDVEGLVPLEEIRVVARVRTPASALTGSPVLELLELLGR